MLCESSSCSKLAALRNLKRHSPIWCYIPIKFHNGFDTDQVLQMHYSLAQCTCLSSVCDNIICQLGGVIKASLKGNFVVKIASFLLSKQAHDAHTFKSNEECGKSSKNRTELFTNFADRSKHDQKVHWIA